MANRLNPNLEILLQALDALGPLADELVFLGGCAVGLLVTDSAAPAVRVTQDVDVLTEAASLADYYRLADRLRERGFAEDRGPQAPICRWRTGGVLLDVMPTDPAVLGFGNRWYRAAMAASMPLTLPGGRTIRMISAPHFVATKLEAFDGRGGGDYGASHDIEDLVAVLDGRPEILVEVRQADAELAEYLARRFTGLLRSSQFRQALPGHLPPDAASQARVRLIEQRMRELIGEQGG